MFNVALIALGRIGKMHADILLNKIPNVRLHTVIDKYVTAEEMEKMGFRDVELSNDPSVAANNPEVDAVVICASTTSHPDLCRLFIEAGKHVFCEKPVSLELEVLEELRELKKKHKVKFQIAFNRRFDPDYREMKKRIEAGTIGKLYTLRIVNRDPKSPPIEFAKKSGGLFYDFNTHDFDMVDFLTGRKVKKIYVEAANLIEPELGKFGDVDTALITITLDDGTLVSIDTSRETNFGYDQRLEALGAGGLLSVNNIRKSNVWSITPENELSALPKADFMERYAQAYIDQFHSFFRALENGSECEVGLDQAINAIRIANACMKSHKTGAPVIL